MLLVKNGRVITPMRVIENGAVLLNGDTIAAVGVEAEMTVPADTPVIDAGGGYIAPGFIETHVHGGGGGAVNNGTVDDILTCGRLHAKGGVTSFLPSSSALPRETLEVVMEACTEALTLEYDGARVLGLHMEGPYLNVAQKGGMSAVNLRPPSADEYIPLLDKYPCVKRMTVAPELPGALELGRELFGRGIVASIGHSDASYQEVVRAVENGFTHVTHLYSAMSTVRREQAYRVAGVLEATMILDELTTELITDGHHLPPSLIKLALKTKGSNRICLTTDAMFAAGLGPGRYELRGREFIVEDVVPSVFEVPGRPGDCVAKLPDRSVFASSVATMDQAIRTMVQMVGLSIPEAVKMATLTTARIHHIDHERGMLAPGLKGDVVVFDEQIRIQATIVEGRLVYNSEPAAKKG